MTARVVERATDRHVRLGAAVRAARVEAGLNQTELGERLGLSQRAVSALENGDRGSLQGRLAAVEGALLLPRGELVERAERIGPEDLSGLFDNRGRRAKAHVLTPPDGTPRWSLSEAADLLGVSTLSVWRMATRWYGHPGSGKDCPGLTPTDMKVAWAWLVLDGHTSRALKARAEAAIRADPEAVWLLVTAPTVTAFHTPEDVVAAWLDSPAPVGRLIRVDGEGC